MQRLNLIFNIHYVKFMKTNKSLKFKLIVKILLWISPLINLSWNKFVVKISSINALDYMGEYHIVNWHILIGIAADFLLFFIVVNILFQYLYLVLITTFKSSYNVITLCFMLFYLMSIICLDYIFAKGQRSVTEYFLILLSFVPFYIVVYILQRLRNAIENTSNKWSSDQ